MKNKTLVILIPDSFKELAEKGELIENYYNPGNLFKNIKIISTNSDETNKEEIIHAFGDANVEFISLKISQFIFYISFFYTPLFLFFYFVKVVYSIYKTEPSLIRCHGKDLNIFIAYFCKKIFKIPFVVSLHTNSVNNPFFLSKISEITYDQRYLQSENKFYKKRLEKFSNLCLKNSDLVIPVYENITDDLIRNNINNFRVVYNVINKKIIKKKDYNSRNNFKIICVTRLIPEKNPINIIKSIKNLKDVNLQIYGDGVLYNDLIKLIEKLRLSDQVSINKSIKNSRLSKILKDFDLFACHSDYQEISKSVLEALSCGLPVVINKNPYKPIKEISNDMVFFYKPKPDDLHKLFKKLIKNKKIREKVGKKGRQEFERFCNPIKIEKKVVGIYKEFSRN